jgi:hypothetical protein
MQRPPVSYTTYVACRRESYVEQPTQASGLSQQETVTESQQHSKAETPSPIQTPKRKRAGCKNCASELLHPCLCTVSCFTCMLYMPWVTVFQIEHVEVTMACSETKTDFQYIFHVHCIFLLHSFVAEICGNYWDFSEFHVVCVKNKASWWQTHAEQSMAKNGRGPINQQEHALHTWISDCCLHVAWLRFSYKH